MAFFDQALVLSSAQAITATATSTNVYDVTGAGVGTVPNMVFGTTVIAGLDIGLGDSNARPVLLLNIPTAFTTGNGATLTAQLQAAPDNGSGGAGTYVTIAQTGVLTAANLAQGGQIVLPIPPIPPSFTGLPRFYRVNYVVGTGVFTAGAINAEILINPPSRLENTQYPNNFVVA